MKRLSGMMVLALVMLMALTSFATAGEKDVLKALEKIKGAVEAGVTYQRYVELVADAKVEINMFKRGGKTNECFIEAVEASYLLYNWAATNWQMKIDFESLASEFSIDAKYAKSDELRAGYMRSAELAGEIATLGGELSGKWKRATTYLDKAYECLK